MLVYLGGGAFMHRATMYILQGFFVNMCFVSLGKISRSGIAGSEDRYIFSFVRNCFLEWI